MYLISACLAGVKCRHNGTSSSVPRLAELVKDGKAVAVCPEVLGGLETPREPCEIVNTLDGKREAVSRSGKDYTDAFRTGAEKTLAVCKKYGIEKAILKSRSPSCGFGEIRDGSFTGKLARGNGFTAELLSRHGIAVLNEKSRTE